MGLRKGDMIKSKINGVEGIIVELKKQKAVIFCTLDPILGEVGVLLPMNLSHCRKVTRPTERELPYGT